MYRFALINFFIWLTVYCTGNEIVALRKHLDTIPFNEQVNYISELPYGLLVTNNKELIPLYHKYITLLGNEHNALLLAKLYERLSLVYYFNGKYDENLRFGLNATQIYDSLNLKVELGNMYGELGYQTKRRDMHKAFELMQKGKSILENENSLEQLSKIYDNYGVLHEMTNNVDSALYFYSKALNIKLQRNDSIGLPYTLCNIFMAFMINEQSDSALFYLNEASRIRNLTNDKIGITECLSYYGDYYIQINKPNLAIHNYKKALKNSITFNYPHLINEMYKKLSSIYEEQNMLDEALSYFKLHKQYQDSILNIETNKTVADLQVKYETAEKEKEIDRKNLELKSKSLQILILIILFVLATVVFILIYSRHKQKKKLELQQKINQEKNLRFIEVIESEEKERTRVARELHDGLGQLLSSAKMNLSALEETINDEDKYLLENSEKLIDQSVSEVRTISHNLMPVSLMRYGLKATINEMVHRLNDTQKILVETHFKNLDKRLAESDERTIYRLIQEIVNNIIKHAEATSIKLNMALELNGEIAITIINNGKTFNVSMLKEAKGIGWKNIYARVNMLNGNVRIEPGKENGTKINITLNTNGG